MKTALPIRKPKPKPVHQATSFWLTADRSQFTKQAYQHFALVRDPTAGITMPRRTSWDL